MGTSDAARELAALRRRQTTTCATCGTVIEGTTRRRFCSDTCRAKAHYRELVRRKAQQEAPP